MRLALGRSRWWRIPIHDSWRREHNIWPRRWCVRITVRIRGRRIVPCIGARRGWIRCTWERLWRVLGKRRWVGGLFSPGGSRLFLVTAHEIFLSGVGIVVGWGDKYVGKRLSRTSGATLVEQRKIGEKDKVKEKRGRRTSAVGRSGFQDLVAAQTQACDGAPPQFRASRYFTTAPSRCNVTGKIFLSGTVRWGARGR
jgi:hypothetical protein